MRYWRKNYLSIKKIDPSERFGLKRDNYILDPRTSEEDRRFYAKRPTSVQLDKQITDLESDLATKISPKKLYWGVIGGGKTHTLYNILEELGDRLDIEVIFVECPVTKKALNFAELYRKVFDEMGMDLVVNDLLRGVVSSIIQKTGLFELGKAEKELIKTLKYEDLARAAYTILTSASEFNPLTIWRWLKAEEISTTDREVLRVSAELKTDPEVLANILILFGRFMQEQKQKTLVLVFDELDRIKEASFDAKETFKAAFTKLTDPAQKYVSVFLCASADSAKDVPDLISEAVEERLKYNIMEIPAMNSDDVLPFTKDMIGYIRDASKDVKKLMKKAEEETDEKLDIDLYPFTCEAIESIKNSCGDKITPRAITLSMTKGVGRASIRGKNVITSKEVVA
jgi:hypothetical protein